MLSRGISLHPDRAHAVLESIPLFALMHQKDMADDVRSLISNENQAFLPSGLINFFDEIWPQIAHDVRSTETQED